MSRQAILQELANAGLVDIQTAADLDGDPAATIAARTPVADGNTTGAVPVVHRILLPSGADGNVDVAVDQKTRIIDAAAVLKGAGTAGSDVQVQNVTTPITDLIDVSAGADTAVFRAGQIDDAAHEVAAGANLRVAYSSTGGNFPGAEVYVYGLVVA